MTVLKYPTFNAPNDPDIYGTSIISEWEAAGTITAAEARERRVNWYGLTLEQHDANEVIRKAIASGERCAVQGCTRIPSQGHHHDWSDPFGAGMISDACR